MRLLLDNNLSPRLVSLLSQRGHDVEHVRDLGLQAASDTVVLARARADDRVLVSADTDFGTLLASSGADRPSVVLIRRSRDRGVSALAGLIAANLGAVAPDLEAGAVVVFSDRGLRARRLPIPPGPPNGR